MSSTLMPSDMHDKMKDTENRVPRIANLPPSSSGSATIQRKFLYGLRVRSCMCWFAFLYLLHHVHSRLPDLHREHGYRSAIYTFHRKGGGFSRLPRGNDIQQGQIMVRLGNRQQRFPPQPFV